MGNRRRAYRPNSRTRQKRASQRRDWELEDLEGEVSQHAAETRDGGGEAVQPAWRRMFTLEKRPRTQAERDETPWSIAGYLTMTLIIAVLAVPLSAVAFFANNPDHTSFGGILVLTLAPRLIPFNLLLCALVAMPLARGLARQPRTLRILEILGYAAVVQIMLIFFFTPVYQTNGYFYDNGKGVAAGAFATVAGLLVGSLAYGPITKWLTRRRPPRPAR